MDFAVPGFDNLQYSTANICGNPGTTLSKTQSAICGGVKPADCNCAQIPTHTDALRKMREGCELFKKWGWWSGTPTLDWRPVPCPKKFVEQVKLGAAFGPRGPVTIQFNEVGSNRSALPSESNNVISVHKPRLAPPGAAAVFVPLLVIVGIGLVAVQRRHRQPVNYLLVAEA